MASRAQVEDIDALRCFRAYLAKLADVLGLALADADAEINRALIWLQTEQRAYWVGQIRKRQERLAAAEQALRNKQSCPAADGSRPSAGEEQRAVALATDGLAEAEAKLAETKAWIRRFAKESSLYRGEVMPLRNQITAVIPTALGQLDYAVNQLDQYLAVPTEAVSEAPRTGVPEVAPPAAAGDENPQRGEPRSKTGKREHMEDA
jgi:hypothetical protein